MHLVGHHETAGNVARYEEQLGAALDLYQRLGIDSVKTGYVADAGGIRAREATERSATNGTTASSCRAITSRS